MRENEVPEVITDSNQTRGTGSVFRNINSYPTSMRETNKLREAIPQILAVIASGSFLFLTRGSILIFENIIPPLLSTKMMKQNQTVPEEYNDLTYSQWIFFNLACGVLGCVLGGFFSHYFGRKISMLSANILFIQLWITLNYTTTNSVMYVSYALMIAGSGLGMASALTYIAEITQPHLRGTLLATTIFAQTIGTLTQQFIKDRPNSATLSFIQLTYPVIGCILLLLIPESPYWLAGKSHILNAEESLRWLRGWPSASHVHDELQMICRMVDYPTSTHSIPKKSYWHTFYEKKFLLPFTLVILTFFIVTVNEILMIVPLIIHPNYYYTTFVVKLLSAVSCVIIIPLSGRRFFSFLSLGGLIFSHIVLIAIASSNDIINIDTWWIAALFGLTENMNTFIQVIPLMLVGEVFPARIRSIATSLAIAFYFIVLSIVKTSVVLSHMYLEFLAILVGLLIIMIVGAVALYFLLPETEGATLKEIEDHYADIKKLPSRF